MGVHAEEHHDLCKKQALEEPKNTLTWVMCEMSVSTARANGLLFSPEHPKLPDGTLCLKKHLRDHGSIQVFWNMSPPCWKWVSIAVHAMLDRDQTSETMSIWSGATCH